MDCTFILIKKKYHNYYISDASVEKLWHALKKACTFFLNLKFINKHFFFKQHMMSEKYIQIQIDIKFVL